SGGGDSANNVSNAPTSSAGGGGDASSASPSTGTDTGQPAEESPAEAAKRTEAANRELTQQSFAGSDGSWSGTATQDADGATSPNDDGFTVTLLLKGDPIEGWRPRANTETPSRHKTA